MFLFLKPLFWNRFILFISIVHFIWLPSILCFTSFVSILKLSLLIVGFASIVGFHFSFASLRLNLFFLQSFLSIGCVCFRWTCWNFDWNPTFLFYYCGIMVFLFRSLLHRFSCSVLIVSNVALDWMLMFVLYFCLWQFYRFFTSALVYVLLFFCFFRKCGGWFYYIFSQHAY